MRSLPAILDKSAIALQYECFLYAKSPFQLRVRNSFLTEALLLQALISIAFSVWVLVTSQLDLTIFIDSISFLCQSST